MGSKSRRKRKPAQRPQTPPTRPTDLPALGGGDEKGATEEPLCEVTEVRLGENAEGDADELGGISQLVAVGHDSVPSAVPVDTNSDASSSRGDPRIPLEDARHVLERLFLAMLAARLSPTQALDPSGHVLVDDLQERFESQERGESVVLSLIHRRAICAVANATNEDERIDTASLQELALAATFRVELLEFQIRQAVLDRAGSKSRGKVDVQRVLAKMASSLPADALSTTAKDFERLLEEKLSVSATSSVLTKVVFARMIGAPFADTLPKQLACARQRFFAALESFVVEKPLSMDSVEGQLRNLVGHGADLRTRFQALDADGSGSVSVDEFVAFLEREAHMRYPREVLRAFVQRFDVDGDGTLNYDEFVAFMGPKQFGIQVLTPFGMFYQAADRHESMGDVDAKIKTRMFWMQHTDLFATSTSVHAVNTKPPLKLKVTDQFILTHHYGTMRLQYAPSDPIAKVLTNGEMVVLLPNNSDAITTGDRLPPFEYRVKPSVNTKRSIPPLLSWSLRAPSRDQVSPKAMKPVGVMHKAVAPARACNTIRADEAASVASSNTDTATRRRSTMLSCTAKSMRPRRASSSRSSPPHHHCVETRAVKNTETKKRSQKGALRTQSTSDLTSEQQDVIIDSSRTSSFCDYLYDEHEDNPTDDNDEAEEEDGSKPENPSEQEAATFGLDSSAGGDEAACTTELCVEDAAVFHGSSCDEESPPPSYYFDAGG